jgi:uncharacterized protein YndB with AHSA1/START domain
VTDADAPIAPIVMKVALSCEPMRAFDYFTRDIGRWWPLARFSCAGEDALDVAFEPRAGGALTERARDGTLHRWGTVSAWEPGRRVAFSWHPGGDGTEATRVEIAFTPTPAGCVVTLTHAGFEALGARARKVKSEYENGWPAVFGERYAGWCATRAKGEAS